MFTKQTSNRFILIVILGLLAAIGPFSIDMYLPGFPAIANDLHSSIAQVSLSLSSFFIGISTGQLLYGPLLDRFGRKKPLYFGIIIYILASLGCALAPSVNALILLRLLQALGGCAGMVASRAMVRDLFPVHENAKVFSMLMLVIGVSPIIAPTVGGYITAAFHWQYMFVALTLMGAAILAATHFLLPESKMPDPQFSLKPAPIIKNFSNVLQTPQFYTYALTGAISAAGLYAYISGSPYVFMELFKVTEQQYGWIFSGIAATYILSSQLNTVLLKKFRSEQIIKAALLCQCTAACLLAAGSALHLLGLFQTIALIALFLCCQGCSFPNASALALAPFSKQAGSASALMGAIQMGAGAFTSAMVSLLNNHTALPMAGMMAICALVSTGILLTGSTIIKWKARQNDIEEQTIELAKEC